MTRGIARLAAASAGVVALGASAGPVHAHLGERHDTPRPIAPLIERVIGEVDAGTGKVVDGRLPAEAARRRSRDREHAERSGRDGTHRNSAYALAGGCFALRSRSLERFVVKDGGDYAVDGEEIDDAERFRLQATDLGKYLLYGADEDFLAVDGGGDVAPASEPSDDAEWEVDEAKKDSFTLTSSPSGRRLAAGDNGELEVVDAQEAGSAGRFTFERTDDCADYPEIELNAKGKPHEGNGPNGKVVGFVEAHLHVMFFEALGGRFHCGRPWHRFGVAFALPDCADEYGPNGSAAPVQNHLNFGAPVHPHDTRGWPTFNDWPQHDTLTYELAYHRWLERAWRGGLRVMVALNTDNQVLCDLYQPKRHGCNEMDSVRRQIADLHALQDYIDAQNGGPNKGWFRIVGSPNDARRVINRGKLAVIPGIETSKLLDCGLFNGVPECDEDDIKERLDEVHDLGIRQMELINKFDNGFGGVAGDSGDTGPVVNTGNFIETGRFWDMDTCEGKAEDKPQPTVPVHTDIGGALVPLLPPGAVPVYPPPPHCNQLGLSSLGEHIVERMMAKGMIVDPDHLSVIARRQALAVLDRADYPGVISSHSWADKPSWRRILKLGGLVTPYAGTTPSFVSQWKQLRELDGGGDGFALGYGSDVNGLGSQGGPRDGDRPVRYPFKSFDGSVTFDAQRSGERVFDINSDGLAHHGLYPDWIEDLRRIEGDDIVEDLSQGAEAYLRMWERALERSHKLD
jgi:hypothetical protein